MQQLNEKEKSYFDFIIKSGKNLSAIIDDMLAYSKIGSQKLNLKSVNTDVLIKETISSLTSVAEQNNISIKQISTFPNATADELKLRRVFQNVISNAIKFYDPNKTERHIQLDYKEIDNRHQFSISDNGLGIAETSKDLFEPFTYLNSKDTYEGTGMGLAMCKKIVEKHGGEIWYESEVQKSTNFYFTIKKKQNTIAAHNN